MESSRCKSDLTIALETERKAASDMSKTLEEERSRHASTQSLLQQVTGAASLPRGFVSTAEPGELRSSQNHQIRVGFTEKDGSLATDPEL